MEHIKELISQSKQLKLLYVEDNNTVMQQTVKMLDNYFDNVITANDGIDGFEKFKRGKFDVVFTDIQMPNSNGLEMLGKIRKMDPQIPIVVCSAYDNKDYLMESIDVGVDKYILKPFDFNELTIAVQKVVNKLNKSDDRQNILYMDNGFIWDKDLNGLFKDNRPIKLTKNETALIELLASYPNKIFTSHEIEEYIFHDEFDDNKRLRNLISRLRVKTKESIIETLYSQGYKLKL